MANRRAKWSDIRDSAALVEHIWDNVDLVMFKDILVSFLGYSVHLSQNALLLKKKTPTCRTKH